MDTQRPTVADIECAIRHYLQAHPNAVDTERGIGEWWLGSGHPPCTPSALQAAIENLVAAGVLQTLTLPDGRRAFSGAKAARPGTPDPH